MSIPDAEKIALRLIEAAGGKDQFFAKMDQRVKEFNNIWKQDAERIGRVLRAHLAVEYFLTMYLSFKNPNLGSLSEARLSFSQKVDLLNDNEWAACELKPGLRRLNKVRNRIAHQLKVDIREEDREVFASRPLFAAMQAEKAKRFGALADDPLSVLEQFSQFAAGMLHSGAYDEGKDWADAFKDSGAIEQSAEQKPGPP